MDCGIEKGSASSHYNSEVTKAWRHSTPEGLGALGPTLRVKMQKYQLHDLRNVQGKMHLGNGSTRVIVNLIASKGLKGQVNERQCQSEVGLRDDEDGGQEQGGVY
jgi:hypothetical protein